MLVSIHPDLQLAAHTAALAGLTSRIRCALEARCWPARGAGYTKAQYDDAVAALLESPHNAVGLSQMEQLLGDGDRSEGAAALEALLQAGLLALRPYSDWARDMEPAAFGPHSLPVITAPSAVHLHVMKSDQVWPSVLLCECCTAVLLYCLCNC